MHPRWPTEVPCATNYEHVNVENGPVFQYFFLLKLTYLEAGGYWGIL